MRKLGEIDHNLGHINLLLNFGISFVSGMAKLQLSNLVCTLLM